MKIKLLFSLLMGLFLFIFAPNIKSQDIQPPTTNIIIIGAKKTASITGKVSYFIAKETAQLAWETTNFTASEIVAPTAQYLVVKTTPKVSIFVLKTSIKTIRKSTPIATKAVVSYLKL